LVVIVFMSLFKPWSKSIAGVCGSPASRSTIFRSSSCAVLQELEGKNGFRLVRSISQLHWKKLALAILGRQIAVFLAEANLSYLHRCANTTSCRLYFYDTTKNHRRQWCSVATCGNRHKVAQFRQRRAKIDG
jgi:predicted RNA-binding Zn ribbon-like protein